jgi:hypothetical protein
MERVKLSTEMSGWHSYELENPLLSTHKIQVYENELQSSTEIALCRTSDAKKRPQSLIINTSQQHHHQGRVPEQNIYG